MGRTIEWSGSGVEEVGRDAKSGEVMVRIDPRYYRPTEVEFLLGDPSKAAKTLGWRHTTTLEEMVAEMVATDLELVERDAWRRDRTVD